MKRLISAVIAAAMIFSILCTGAISSLAASAEQIQAKKDLKSILVYYRIFAQRVTLEEYKKVDEYKNYTENLLPEAETMLKRTEYYTVEEYTDITNRLENSWKTWRTYMPISYGIYAQRSQMLNGISQQVAYNANSWTRFNSQLTMVYQITDDLKNSIYAPDVLGKGALALLESIISDMKNGTEAVNSEALAAKSQIIGVFDAYYSQILRDTKEVKSPETTELINTLNSISEVLSDNSASAEECNGIYSKLDTALTAMQQAVSIGRPFILKARELYATVSSNVDTYTRESWKRVSDAINKCDAVYPAGTDAECAAAFAALKNAIALLILREPSTATITVSSAIGAASDTVIIGIDISAGSDMMYGMFDLYYDSGALEIESISGVNAVFGDSTVSFSVDYSPSLIAAYRIAEISFRIKDYACAGEYALELKTTNIRDSYGDIIGTVINNGAVTVNSPYINGDIDDSGEITVSDARKALTYSASSDSQSNEILATADYNKNGSITAADARDILLLSLGVTPTCTVFLDDGEKISSVSAEKNEIKKYVTVPEKEGYVFTGWYTASDEKVTEDIYMCRSRTLHAEWEKFDATTMQKGEIMISGYIAIHNAYAIEDDFRMLKECGLDFIILDYTHNDAISEQCLKWAEKYGIRTVIHDYALNAIAEPTVEDILYYTAAYSSSPSFVGNNLFDEPSLDQLYDLLYATDAYSEAMPGYDMHINLFPKYGIEALTGVSYTDYIERYALLIEANHISIDPYPFSAVGGVKFTYADYYSSLYETALLAQRKKMDFWVYTQTITGFEGRVIDIADIRFQYYACLAFGADKIMNYCYDVSGYSPDSIYSAEVYCMRDYAHNYTELYDYVQLVNTEVGAFSDEYAKYAWKDTYYIPAEVNPAYIKDLDRFSEKEFIVASANVSIIVGKFTDENENNAFLFCNAGELDNAETALLRLNINKAPSANVWLDGAKNVMTPDKYGYIRVNLKPGQGVFVTVN